MIVKVERLRAKYKKKLRESERARLIYIQKFSQSENKTMANTSISEQQYE